VAAFGLVPDRVTDVMQQGAATGQASVELQLAGQAGCQVSHLDAVPTQVLALDVAELESAEQRQQRSGEGHPDLVGRRAPQLLHRRLHLLTRLGHHHLDAGRVHAPLVHQARQRPARDLPPHGVEAGDDHHPGGVVDEQIDAGLALEGANVSPVAADQDALEVLRGQGDGRDHGLVGVVDRGALQSAQEQVAGATSQLVGEADLFPSDHLLGLFAAVALDPVEEQALRLFAAQVCDPLQLTQLAIEGAIDLGLACLERGLAPGHRCGGLAGLTLAVFERLHPTVEGVLALPAASLELVEAFLPALRLLLKGRALAEQPLAALSLCLAAQLVPQQLANADPRLRNQPAQRPSRSGHATAQSAEEQREGVQSCLPRRSPPQSPGGKDLLIVAEGPTGSRNGHAMVSGA